MVHVPVNTTVLTTKIINDYETPIIKFQIGDCIKHVISDVDEFYLETDDQIFYLNTKSNTNKQKKYEKRKNDWELYINKYPTSNLLFYSYNDDDVQYVNMTTTSCHKAINVELAQNVLSTFAPALDIEVNELQNMNVSDIWIYYEQDPNEILDKNFILLCLNVNNKCISSIVLAPLDENPDVIELILATRDTAQRRGYNTILHAVAVLILPLLWTNATHIYSKAVSPASAWIMINKFGALSPLQTKLEIQEFIRINKFLITQIPLDEHHKEIAEGIVDEFLSNV